MLCTFSAAFFPAKKCKRPLFSSYRELAFGEAIACMLSGPFKVKCEIKESSVPLNPRISFATLVMVAAFASTASADQLVTNGDFQTGTFSGWTVNENTNNPWYVASLNSNFYAVGNCAGTPCVDGPMSGEAYLYQNLATIPGGTYTLTFDYRAGNGIGNNLIVYFGSELVDLLINTSGFAIVTYTDPGLVASSSSTRLEFLERQSTFGDELSNMSYLDNISVTGIESTTPTPEPETIAMVGTGLLGLFGAVRRKVFA
jgi:hypothetical protein